jgi:hypothetical protein
MAARRSAIWREGRMLPCSTRWIVTVAQLTCRANSA